MKEGEILQVKMISKISGKFRIESGASPVCSEFCSDKMFKKAKLRIVALVATLFSSMLQNPRRKRHIENNAPADQSPITVKHRENKTHSVQVSHGTHHQARSYSLTLIYNSARALSLGSINAVLTSSITSKKDHHGEKYPFPINFYFQLHVKKVLWNLKDGPNNIYRQGQRGECTVFPRIVLHALIYVTQK